MYVQRLLLTQEIWGVSSMCHKAMCCCCCCSDFYCSVDIFAQLRTQWTFLPDCTAIKSTNNNQKMLRMPKKRLMILYNQTAGIRRKNGHKEWRSYKWSHDELTISSAPLLLVEILAAGDARTNTAIKEHYYYYYMDAWNGVDRSDSEMVCVKVRKRVHRCSCALMCRYAKHHSVYAYPIG